MSEDTKEEIISKSNERLMSLYKLIMVENYEAA